jgi:carboxylesterase
MQNSAMHRQGILLIHGLTGSPHEFVPVEASLRQAGYHTRLVTLPGHGDRPTQRFHETSALEILDHCASEYQHLADEVDEVYIVGHSLGGICTLLTAAVRPPKLKGVVVFSAPYEHAYFYNYVHGLARMPIPHLLRSICLAPRDRIRFTRPDCKPWNVPKLLQQSRVIFSLMKEHIHAIEVPVSLAHSIYDLTIPYAEMQKLADRIGKPGRVKMTTLTKSGHRIFPISQDMDEAIRVIFDFLERDCAVLASREISTPAAASIVS